MANTKITDLGALTAAAGDEIPVNRAGTDGKITAGAVADLAVAEVGDVREILTASRTYYVRTGGSDSNTGLVNTDGGAFATVQKAWDTIGPLDLGDFSITIQIADGTYEIATGDYWLDAVRNHPRGGAGGSVTIQGNTGNKTAVQVNCNNADFISEIISNVPDMCSIEIQFITFANADNANDSGFAIGGSQVFFSDIGTSVGATSHHFIIGQNSYCGFFGACTIASGGVNYLRLYENSFCAWNMTSLTATGSCAFSDAFIRVMRESFCIRGTGISTTFTGTYTGPRFIVEENSTITTTSTALTLTFFPGDADGIIRDSGIYTSPSGTSYQGIEEIWVGNSSDTSLTRSSAGNIAVEGTVVYKTGAVPAVVGITIDGGGSAITTGVKGYIRVPFAATITSAAITADQAGAIVIDVWNEVTASYPPTDADSITASAPITIPASDDIVVDSTLTGWDTAIAAGDVLGFNVDSCATITRATVVLSVLK